MSDLISRQDAIDALEGYKNCIKAVLGDENELIKIVITCRKLIDELPPAQPENEKRTAETAQNVPNGDLISRKMAIDALMEDFKRIPTNAIRAKTVIEQLPSAQPEHIRINLNEPIKVKLTDWGKEIYYHQYDRTNQIAGREICKPKFPKEDENGYTEFQLWCFIELYGEYMGITLPNVIEPIEIVYKR